MLIENPAFIGNYTGFKNLKVLASIQNRVDDEHIREVIRQVGLDLMIRELTGSILLV